MGTNNDNFDEELNKRFDESKRVIDAGNIDPYVKYFVDTVINSSDIDVQSMEIGDRRSFVSYESAKRNSVGTDKVSVDKRKKVSDEKFNKRKKIFIVAAVISVAVSGGGIIVYNAHKDYSLVSETVGYQSAVEHTLNAHDPNNPAAYFYDTSAIAQDIANTNDFDDNIYGVYYKFNGDGYNVIESMDEVVYKCHLYGDFGYESFTDYLKSRGLVNDDGSINLNKYQAQAALELAENSNGKAK